MGSAAEFPGAGAGPDAGIHSGIEAERAQWVVVRNSRFLLGVVFAASLAAAFMAACFALIALSVLVPVHGMSFSRLANASSWAFAGLCTFLSCPWLWKMGKIMAHNEARLDSRGVDFLFGSSKAPRELFLAWDQIDSIRNRRSGNSQVFTVTARDGSEAMFSSYSFFRPRKLARLIAARAGRTIEKG